MAAHLDTTITSPTTTFAPAAWQALRALRTRYGQHRDLFSAGELARLRFLRWLYQTGRLVP